MVNQKQTIFRQESLERLSSPERLDQLMQVVAPRDWLVLATLGSLVLGAVGWSIWGRIPITVEGRGVLLYPYQTSEIQSPISGQLVGLSLKPGDLVQKGQVIGRINRIDLQQAIRQHRLKLRSLEQQNQQLTQLTSRQQAQEIQVLRQKQQTLQKTLQNKQQFINITRNNERLTLQRQRQSVEQTLRDKQALSPILKQQLQNRLKLQDNGAIPSDLVLQTTQSYQENQQQIANLKTQLQALNQQKIEIEKNYQSAIADIANLQNQIREIKSQEQALPRRSLEEAIIRNNQIQEVKQQLAQFTLQLKQNSQIISEQSGKILEINAKPGQILTQGSRIGLVEMSGKNPQLVGMIYFSIKDGKRVKPGMAMQITPDSVQRERYGSIFGTVKAVSPFPVSQQTILSAIGNTEVTEGLIIPGGQMEVLAELSRDPTTITGYRWSSSQGPSIEISSGTTATVRVMMEEQAPITFVLPILRSFTNTH